MDQDKIWITVIERAISKGWVPNPLLKEGFKWSFRGSTFFTKTPIWNGNTVTEEMGAANIERLIFDHAFAKTFFGEFWIDRITEVVLSTDRSAYFKEYLESNELITDSLELSTTQV